MACEAILKAKVDGVYEKTREARDAVAGYDDVTYDDLGKTLGVMDASAIALARDKARLPIIVFSLDEAGRVQGDFAGEGTYTRVAG